MTPQQFDRVQQLFRQSYALPVHERFAFLSTQCPDDLDVRAKVERMLTHAEAQTVEQGSDGDRFLDLPAMGRGFHVAEVDEIERRLKDEIESAGRYRLLEPVGEGGFGTVYKAEQLQPVRRLVALKVIKLGMDTRRLIARFEAERQTLAMMEHPAIARVYDAGATASGRPYFAMELVAGIPITKFSDSNRLAPRQRIEVFLQVASAVQYAHQKGIIHRDIKPSNVLVAICENKPQPKLIDFGIARAMDDSIGGRTLLTEHGQLVGTPEYMSPEQAEASGDIDTRTDIYSLGILLYELMIGATPFEDHARNGCSPIQIQQMIRDQTLPTPSARLKTLGDKVEIIAGQRMTDISTLRRMLRGDLDWIIMNAIEKDRSRRYETADAFSADLRRYLNDEAVLARPPNAGYRFRKFARRNKGPLAASFVIFMLLLAGVIGTAAGMVNARREARAARTESEISRAVSDFLNQDLLSAVAPDQLGNDVPMRRVIEVASQRVDGKFRDQPLVEAAVRLSLGRTFSKLSDLPAAQRHLEKSLELRRAALGDRSPEALEAGHELALVFKLQDRNAEAGPLRQA